MNKESKIVLAFSSIFTLMQIVSLAIDIMYYQGCASMDEKIDVVTLSLTVLPLIIFVLSVLQKRHKMLIATMCVWCISFMAYALSDKITVYMHFMQYEYMYHWYCAYSIYYYSTIVIFSQLVYVGILYSLLRKNQ